MSERWRVETFVGDEGLRRLEPHWDLLVEQMPERCWHHSYASHRAYFDHLSSPDTFVGLVVRDAAGEIRAICPFEERRRSILRVQARVWELPWDRHNLVRDVICPPGELRGALLGHVRRHLKHIAGSPPVVLLSRVTERSAAWECARALRDEEVCVEPHGAVDVIDTTLTEEDQSERQSTKFRGNLRRAHRKLDELSDAHYVHATEGARLREEFAAFLALEASGWKGREGTGTAIRLDPPLKTFYDHLVAQLPGVEINALYAEGNCLASQLCARNGGDYALLKVCYNEDYAKISPGKLLLDHVVKRCSRDEEIETFNLVSHFDWFQDWSPDVVSAFTLHVSADGWKGRLLLRTLRARFRHGPRLKRWFQRIPGARLLQG
jgi:hypothetical protein